MELIRNIWKDRYNFALYISLAASVLNGIGLLTFGTEGSARNMLGALALFFGIGLTLCAYLLGGFWTAVKSALGIAKWGWLVVPFPYDLATGVAAFGIAMIVLFLFPIVPICKARREHQNMQFIARQVS